MNRYRWKSWMVVPVATKSKSMPHRQIFKDNVMILANMSNGLMYEHDEVCYFQSQFGHHKRNGYFRIDSMPIKPIIHLLKGGDITIVDASRSPKKYTDAQKFGVSSWCIVFNRACSINGYKYLPVCNWMTKDMVSVAASNSHRQHVRTIRKLMRYYGKVKPAVIGDNVNLICHHTDADDNPKRIRDNIMVRGRVS